MFSKEKKCCLNCAFCIRNRLYFYQGDLLASTKARYELLRETLTLDERNLLKHNTADFIGQKIRDYKKWKECYENALAERDAKIDDGTEKIGGFFGIDTSNEIVKIFKDFAKLAYRPSIMHGRDIDDATEALGIQECPANVPERDFLSCWHEQWDEDKNPELIQKRLELASKKCSFYFPFAKLEKKTLDACEQERKADLDKRRYAITSILAVISILGFQFFINCFHNMNKFKTLKLNIQQLKNITITKSLIKQKNKGENNERLKTKVY